VEREPERVLLDVERGYVSRKAARALYGVVITAGAVDSEATTTLRAELKTRAHRTHFHFGPERDAFEQIWTAENYAALTQLLAALPVHWRFFTKTKLFAVMREAAGKLDLAAAFAIIRRDYPQIPEVGADVSEIA
jgi:N-methylhydantoinase B